ncbi:MAG: thioredoxin family protein [Ignavibacteria bacterium]|nr:thioredoxin family protein [Ignavibacteria bacterium]
MKRILFVLVFVFIPFTILAQSKEIKPKVTFVELGSVNCIPCKQMQPVMKSIEEKYGDQVKVVFYDVWKADQKKYAQKYGIRLIPTQVFLDEDGKEFHRHEGFYPEEEIDKLLKKKGLVPNSKKG